MEKTLEIEELMGLLENTNTSLEENEVSVSSMKENILNIKNEESKLKKIYPNLCLLEQMRTNIEMNKDNIKECTEEDEEAIAAFEEVIAKLEEQVSVILKKLEGSDVLDKKDYEVKMKNIKEKKAYIELQINQREKEQLELMEKKKELEDKIKELQNENGIVENDIEEDEIMNNGNIKNQDEENIDEEEIKIDTEGKKDFGVVEEYGVNKIELEEDPHEELERKKKDAIKVQHEIRERKNATKRDLTKATNTGKASELASFIEYEEEIIDENKNSEKVIEKKPSKKKEESIDDIVDEILRNLESIVRKFEEIIGESNDDSLNKNVIYLKNKFGQNIYNYIHDVANKFINKRKEIKELEEKLNTITNEDEDERLTQLNKNLVDDISKIESLQQNFTQEVMKNFNSFKDFVKKESDNLCELNKSLKEEVDLAYSKLSSIEEKLQQLKENSKESILETIREVDGKLAAVDKEERELRENTKDKVVDLLNTFVENVKSSDYCEDLIDIIGELKQKLDKEQSELSSKKVDIEEKRNSLESERKALEEKYKLKKENDTSKQEEEKLAKEKQEVKEEAKKMMETLNVIKGKHNKFERQSEEFKIEIKSDIKRKDVNILKSKNQVLDTINREKKSSKIKLLESINEYNNGYVIEFENYLKKVQDEIDSIEKENDEYKKSATNIVVVSEFEENSQLLEKLKNILEQSINKEKIIEYQNEVQHEEESDIQKEIEKNLSNIKPQDNIILKIDFGEIYEMEDKVKDIDNIKQSLYNLCLKLNMKEEVKNNELKLKEQENFQDKLEEVQYKNKKSSEEQNKVEEENEIEGEEQNQTKQEVVIKRDYKVTANKKKNNNMAGLEEYSDETREVLLNIPWNQLVELKNMNKEYQRILYIEDLEELKNEKVQNIATLKEQYRKLVEYAKKLYDIKKYVLAYKKGMEELAKGAKNNDKTSNKERSNFMKVASKSLKIMKENGVNGFEDFRDKVIKNSDAVKEILSKTKSENENLVKLMGLIQSIQRANEELKAGVK